MGVANYDANVVAAEIRQGSVVLERIEAGGSPRIEAFVDAQARVQLGDQPEDQHIVARFSPDGVRWQVLQISEGKREIPLRPSLIWEATSPVLEIEAIRGFERQKLQLSL